MRILITGNCGYIGSHVASTLEEQGHPLCGIDNLHRGSISNSRCTTHIVDIRDVEGLDEVFETFKPDLVCHFAALTSVPESMEEPDLYYDVNVVGSEKLLGIMKKHNCNKLVFSSTASVYERSIEPVKENSTLQPLNNYAKNKLQIERLIHANSSWLDAVIFRYFNVIGWDEDYDASKELEKTNIVPALRRCYFSGDKFKVYGNSYPVKRANSNDHTGVRDYIDVRDIASAYIEAIKWLDLHKRTQETFNLGTTTGHSVLEIIEAFNKVNNTNIEYEICERRKGDPAIVIANSQKARELLAWTPRYTLNESLKVL